MGKIKSWATYLLTAVAIFLMAATALSLFYNNTTIWWIKSLNFPRIQFLLVTFICLLSFCFLAKQRSVGYWLTVAGLLASAAIHTSFIIAYSPLVAQEVPSQKEEEKTSTKGISLLIVNVHMTNRNAGAFISRVLQRQPDILLVMETNRWWLQALQPLKESYPNQVAYPLENTYGMVLYSKYQLLHPEIKFLQHDSVPSIHVTVQLPDGRSFSFHGVHPVPPMPSQYPDNIGQDAGELEQVARLVAKDTLPVIVAGDFNDVTWSNTSRIFREKSRLKDVRVGRGFYTSFDAKSWIMRWPLDHIFVSEDFALADLEKWPALGSDHFPVYVRLALKAK